MKTIKLLRNEREDSKVVSMKDISMACGVSIATVSKALNGQRDVSAATRENILRVAKKMGYFPNSAARTLKTNRSNNIGVLFVDESRSGLTHDYFANVLDSPDAARRLIDSAEKAILERLNCPEAFEKYNSAKKRKYPYYRIKVGNYIIFYVVIDDIMEVRRFIYGARDINKLLK